MSAQDLVFQSQDVVFLEGIKLDAVVGFDAWHRPNKAQPVIIDLRLMPESNLEAAALDDDVTKTIDYGKLYKSLLKVVASRDFETIMHLYQTVKECLPGVKSWSICISLPKAILLAEEGLRLTWNSSTGPDDVPIVYQCLEVRKIPCKCIVGVNPHERMEKQRLILHIRAIGFESRLSPFMLAGVSLEASPNPVYQEAVKTIVDRVEGSDYQTIEALATAIVQIMTMTFGFDNAQVTIQKPSAITPIQNAGVTIGRNRAFFENKDFWKVKRP